jgi:hypothetical protein
MKFGSPSTQPVRRPRNEAYSSQTDETLFVVLALQNLQGEEVFGHCDHEQTEMVEGLHGSLTMMEKVLNDVLSFNRMESGRVRSRDTGPVFMSY